MSVEPNQNKRNFTKYITELETENPFFHVYVFSEKDLKRNTIKIWQYPLLWFLPTYIQVSDGYEFYFKLWRGRVFLIKTRRF